MIEERSPLHLAREEHAVLRDPSRAWRVVSGYVSVDIVAFNRSGIETGERGFMYNAIPGDAIAPGVLTSSDGSLAVVATAAADATVEDVDAASLGAHEREKVLGRLATCIGRAGGDPSPATAVAPFTTAIADSFTVFARTFVTAGVQDDARDLLRTETGSSLDRIALHRESFEASHILDRHPIPIDPSDDELTAAARIVLGRLDVALVTPMKADRDHASALRAIALASHLVIRRIILRGAWWEGEHGPMVAFSKRDGRPLAVVPHRSGEGYQAIAADPRVQERIDKRHANEFREEAFIFSPTLPMRRPDLRSLMRIGLRNSPLDIVRVLALGLASGLLAIVIPLSIAPLIDRVLPAGLRDILIETTVLLLIAVTAGFTIDVVRNLAIVRVKTRLSSQMQQSVMYRLIGLTPGFFRSFSIADLAARALGIDEVEHYLGDATLTGFLTAVFSIVSLAVIFTQDALLGFVCAAIGVVTIVAFVAQSWLLLPYRRKSLAMTGYLSGFVFQTLTGVAKIRAAAARNRVYVRWLHRFLESRRILASANRIEYRFGIFSSVWPSIATLTIIATIVVAHHGVFEAGKFFTILAAFEQMLAALLGLGYSASALVSIVPIYERLKPILDAVPERDARVGDPGPLSGAISIRDVSFSYEGTSTPALSHVSLEIAPGSFVAMVGPSGSGKSTLLRLLLGFEKPTGGWVGYDHHSLDSLDIVSVRRQIGAVLQTAKLLPGSIFENICGNAILTRDQAKAVAQRVGLWDDIEKMPMKLETVIGASGSGLSGGQRQRIVIARAIASSPKLIFFDEATSALDNATQAVVSATLSGIDATRIVIAHRLSTVVDADNIVVMESGNIVQQGKYADLVAVEGPFKNLVERQRL